MKKIIFSIALLLSAGFSTLTATAQNLVPIPLKMQKTTDNPLVWLNISQVEAPNSLSNEIE